MSSSLSSLTNNHHHQPQPQNENHPINVFDLTLLLKVMGFRLNHLDYYEEAVGPGTSSSDVTVEIRCGKRNIVSRLSAPAELCACPAKREDHETDSSFWEILGTAPSSSPGGAKKRVQDASSNLLADLSKRGVTNTRHLLHLIYEGFRKDHLPSTNSPEQRPEIPPNPVHTSTQLKSPRRQVPVLNADMLVHDGFPEDVVSPNVLTAPPNTPQVPSSSAFGHLPTTSSGQNIRHRDHLVYLEVLAAKERLDKALLAMKVGIAGDFSHLHGPALDLSSHKIFEEAEEAQRTSPATFRRRSSMGSFPSEWLFYFVCGRQLSGSLSFQTSNRRWWTRRRECRW